jgi:hypothetical protein
MSFAYGTAAMALLLVGILIWAPLAPVSAKEVLSRAIVTDNGRQAITPQQVVRQKVRIKKVAAGGGERTAALESWKSSKSAYWHSGADPVNTDLLARYQENGLASALPLSPAVVESWAKIAGSEPSASSEGQHVAVQVVASSTGQQRGLKAVSFYVQTGNWHMDGMTLEFRDATFHISEEHSSILDKHEVPNEILAALELEVDTSLLSSVSATPTRSAELPDTTGEASPAKLDDLEMDVRYALHGIGADLGEGIEIAARPPNRLVINAATASPQRRKQLETLFGSKPGVRLEFEESVNDRVPKRAAAKTIVIPDSDQSSQTPDGRLSQYFGSPTAQENYARSVLQTSTDILAHLYALRELADRWPAVSDGALSPESKAKLAAMVRGHARELQTGTSTLRKKLQLISNGDQPTDQRTATGGIRWQEAGSFGLDAALIVDRTLRALLTVSDVPLSLDQALPRLQKGSRDLELAIDELTKVLN